MDLKINNVGVAVNQGSVNLEAGPYTKFEGTGLKLKVAGQTLSGDFGFEKDANGDVSGAVTNGALKIKSGDNELISLSGISGGFEMSSEGSYGALQVGGSTFTVPGVSLSGGAVTVQMNTVDEEKSGDFNLGGGVETLTFGAGPYLRVDVEGASLELTGLGTLSGDFAFEQSGDVTKVGVSNVTASVDVNGTTGDLEQGKGAMLVTGNGVAGSLEGKLSSGGANFAVGGTLVLRFNNTGLAVDTTVLVGDELVGLSFADAQNVFDVTLGGFTLDIGGVVTIEGDVTFTSQGDYNVFAGENMTLFVGEGPLNKDGARNPDAKGLLVSEATIGLVKKDGKYALSAEGQVSVVGVSGLSLSGPISISYNGFNQLVDEAVAIAGTAKQVAVKFVNDQVATAKIM